MLCNICWPNHKSSILPRFFTATQFFCFFCSRSEEHTSELQSRPHLGCRLLLEKKKYEAGARAAHEEQTCARAGRRSAGWARAGAAVACGGLGADRAAGRRRREARRRVAVRGGR